MTESQTHYLIWGARGHAKVLDEIIRMNGDKVIALVDREKIDNSPIKDVPVLVGHEDYKAWLSDRDDKLSNLAAIAAIGGTRGKDRVEYYQMFKSDGLLTPSLIHSRAYLSDTAEISENCQICALSAIGSDVRMGEACIANTQTSIDHECIIGRGVHIAPGATLCGCIEVGDFSFIGAGATILPNITIGSNVIVGAGSLVTHDITDNVMVLGSPAKIVKELHDA